MKRMKDWLLAAAMVSGLSDVSAIAAEPAKTGADQEQIKSVLDAFHTSIVNKDKSAFQKLFLNDTVPWVGVTSDKGMKLLLSRKTDASKPDPVKIYISDSPTKFISDLIASPQHFDDKFEHVHIDTDGNIAIVYFDYSFFVETYKANWGKESWQMVHAADGWKISSVSWSMDINPELPNAPQPATPAK